MYRVRFEIPLIGQPRNYQEAALAGKVTQSDFRRVTWDAHRMSLPFAITKPTRRLGAGWMDDFVQQGKIVHLCGDCLRHYGKWWNSEQYYPSMAVTSDCDGCGETLVSCTKFEKRTQ